MRSISSGVSLVALALILLGTAHPATALQPPNVFRGALLLEGQIQAGDYDMVRRFLGHKEYFDKISEGVFLASPGGNVLEAIKIGYLLRSLELRTLLPTGNPGGRATYSVIGPQDLKNPKDYMCASACFFLYIAGIDRDSSHIDRLGIHRPTLKAQVWATNSEKGRAAAALRLRRIITYYVQRMGVSEKLIDLMYSVPANRVHWVTKEEYSALIKGQTAELKAALEQNCAPMIKSPVSTALCRRRTEIELAADAWQRTYRSQ